VYDPTDPGNESASVGSLQLPGIYGVTDFPIILVDHTFCPTSGGDSPQPVPMPKPEPDSPRPVPLPDPESQSTAIPPAAAIVQAEAAPVSLEAPGMPARGLYELAWGTGLLNVAAIAQKELAAILRWPIAYLAWALVIVLTSIFGYLPQINASAPVSMSGIFNWLALLMAFFVPLCTMRMLAGEQRSGSLD